MASGMQKTKLFGRKLDSDDSIWLSFSALPAMTRYHEASTYLAAMIRAFSQITSHFKDQLGFRLCGYGRIMKFHSTTKPLQSLGARVTRAGPLNIHRCSNYYIGDLY